MKHRPPGFRASQKRGYTWLVALLLAVPAFADDFTAANALFDAGKFPEAVAAYETIVPKTAHVYFNIGNAHYRGGQLGRAVLNYERARQLAPSDPDILANLKFAEEKLGVAEVNQSPKPVVRLIRSVAAARTSAQWQRYEIVGVWATMLLIAAAVWWPRWRGGLVILAVLAGVGLVAATAVVIYRGVVPPAAVVLVPKTEARFAPLADATVHFQLGEGTKVVIHEDRGQWVLVERADDQQGWVRAEAVERVAKP
ncbi:MAG: tetratricopeptide repeat protein [Verrucomicrobiota bacterium]